MEPSIYFESNRVLSKTLMMGLTFFMPGKGKSSAKQMMKYIGEDTLIKDMDKDVIDDFIIQLRENPAVNDMSLYTYARDFKTLMYFFMRKEYIPAFKIKIPKADKTYSGYFQFIPRLLRRRPYRSFYFSVRPSGRLPAIRRR